MKIAAWVVVALLAGLLLGNWTLRPELQKAQQEISSLREELKRRSARRDAMPSVSSWLRLPEPSTSRGAAATPPADEHEAATPPASEPVERSSEQPRRSPREELQQAMELWKTRSEMARNIFQSRLNASPVQMQLFDQTIDRMNAELAERVREWAQYWKETGHEDPETAVRMVHDLSGVLVRAYDDLDRQLPADWRERAGEHFQLFDFINPEVALPFVEVGNEP